ncbi:uracil-DNA glycosylase [Rhodoplanes elegans]|nr:uracil-DNA glycosylase [Rhodoplanes elegans]
MVGGVDTEILEQATTVRFGFIGNVDVRTFREDESFVVDVGVVDAQKRRGAGDVAGRAAELAAILAGFEGCALKATANKLCFADGKPGAPLMLIGEAPGRDEDLEGLPFVGRSGKLLDRMLAAIGIDRHGPVETAAYIANTVPWRPPGNRTPTPIETQTCLPFVKRQIELADPAVLVCLGAPAAQTLIGIKEGIMKTRGRWFTYHTGRREIRAIATFHPAYLLRQPLAKRLAWRDFLAVKAALAEAAAGRRDGA